MALWLGLLLRLHPVLLGVDPRAGRGVVRGHQLLRGAEAPEGAGGAGEAPRAFQGGEAVESESPGKLAFIGKLPQNYMENHRFSWGFHGGLVGFFGC